MSKKIRPRFFVRYISKAKKAYREGRFLVALKSSINPYFSALKTIIRFHSKYPIKLNTVGFNDISTDDDERIIVERIFLSYRRMKEAQSKCRNIYQPSELWAQHFKEAYEPIIDALSNNKIDTLHYFLTNFGNWNKYTGVSANMLMRRFKSSFIGRRYLKYVYFENHIKLWSWLNGNTDQFKDLSCPTFGNQSGAFCDEYFIVPSSCANEFNASNLLQILELDKRQVIGELGGGCGQLAYYLLKKTKSSSYIDFDLPETLCLAAYYLMKAFPQKKVLLYGEGDFSHDSYSQFDMIFMPSFEIEKLGPDTVDLFINKNSLGEMTQASVSNYLKYILPATTSFFHMNHEIYRNIFSEQLQSPLNKEFPIDLKDFKLLNRYPDIWHMLQNNKIDYYMDIFMYLYTKRQK